MTIISSATRKIEVMSSIGFGYLSDMDQIKTLCTLRKLVILVNPRVVCSDMNVLKPGTCLQNRPRRLILIPQESHSTAGNIVCVDIYCAQ